MSDTFGGEARFTVTIDGDVTEAAQKIEDGLSDAFVRAFRDPKVQKALTGLFKATFDGFQQVGKKGGQAFEGMAQGANRATKKIIKDFEGVGRAAKKATEFKTGNRSLDTLTASVSALTNNFEALLNMTKAQTRALEELGRQERAASSDTERRTRSEVLDAKRQAAIDNTRSQKQAALIRQVGQATTAAIRGFSRFATQAMRSLTRVFEVTWRSAERGVRGFVRIAGTTIRGLASGVQSTFSAMGRTVSSFARGATTALQGLGRGLGTILSGMSRAFSSAFRRDENAFKQSLSHRERALSQSLSRQQAATQRAQNVSQRGVLGGIGVGGLAAGGGLFSLLTSGFERFGQQEQLQLTFQTLLGDADQATAVLQSLSDYARTTAFDFVEVAGSVAQLTAALGDVGKAEDITRFLADVTALTGGTTTQLSNARLAVSQIASAGRLDAANLKQLTENLPGIPFAQILADSFFGGDQAAYSAARDAGELGATVSADAFFDAWQSGVTERFPEIEGFAITAANTVSGLAANLKENFAIFGATLIGLVEEPIKRTMGRISELLGVLGGFVSGSMFEDGGSASSQRAVNPFQSQANWNPGDLVAFEDLPEDMQNALRLSSGWEADQGFVISAEDAALLWAQLQPPSGVLEDQQKYNDMLKELRDALGGAAKAVGAVLGIAAGFKLIRLALIGLTSPLGLLVLSAGTLGAIWQRLNAASLPLRNSMKFLGLVFGEIGQSIGGLVRVMGGKLANLLFGSDDFFGGLGDKLSPFVNTLSRAGAAVSRWIDRFTFFLAIGDAGDFFVSELQKIGDAVSNFSENVVTDLFGIDPYTGFAAESRGGSDVLNLLETTFLAPIIRWFRGPFLDGIKGIGDVFGDIFSAIFGGGGADAHKATADQGVATRVLNVLEDTFLGPIVRFFRGFVANVVEAIGGGVADFGGFLGDIYDAIFGDGEGGVGTRIANVLEDTFLGPIVRFFRGPFSDGVEAVAGFVVDTFRSIVDAVQAGLTLIEPFTDAIGNAIQALFGGGGPEGKGVFSTGEGGGLSGIWEGLKTSLGNISTRVAEILDPVWTAITDWFAATFTIENLLAAGDFVLDLVYAIGNKLGDLLGKPELWLAIGGAAAAILLVISNFFLGVFTGLIGNAPEWGGLILDAINAALGGIIPEDIGDNQVIAAVIGAGIIGVITAGLAIAGKYAYATGGGGVQAGGAQGVFGFGKLAFGIAGDLISGIGREFRALWKGGQFLFTGGKSKILNEDGTNPVFSSTGQKIGAGILAGIAIAFTGFKIGEHVAGEGGILLGILTGAVTGASIGAVIGGGAPGAAIGGVLGGALGAISTLFGQNAAAAKEAADQVNSYADALRGVGGQDLQDTLSDVLLSSVLQLPGDDLAAFGTAFAQADFDFDHLAQQIIEGTATVDVAMQNFLLGLVDDVEDLNGKGEEFLAAIDAWASSGQNIGDFFFDNSDAANVLADSLGELGITTGDVGGIQDVFTDAIKAGGGALELLGNQALIAAGSIKGLNGEDVSSIATSLGDVVVPLDDLVAASDAAQAALENLLNVGSYGGSFQALHDELELTFAGLPEQLAGLTGAELRNAAGPIGDTFAGLLASAVDEGLVTNPVQLDAFQEQLSNDIRALHLEPAAEQMLLNAVEGLDTPESRALIKEKAAAVLELIAGELEAGAAATDGKFNGIGTQVVNSVVMGAGGGSGNYRYTAVRQIGTKIAAEIGQGIKDSTAIADAIVAASVSKKGGTETKTTAGTLTKVDTSGVDAARKTMAQIQAILIVGAVQAARAAQAIGQAITSGINSGSRGAANMAGAAALGAVFAVSRYQDAMFNAGLNLSNAFARGIQQAGAQAIAQAQRTALRVIQITRSILAIASPSKVFVDIGKQVGQGFIQGIKDSEGDMTEAIGTAIENAITKGTERAGAAVRRSQVGEAIFGALTPSTLPGGTSTAAQTLSRLNLQQQLAEFSTQFRSTASELLGTRTAGTNEKAIIGVNQSILKFQEAFNSIAQEWNDAWHLRAGTNNEGVPQPLSLSQQNLLATGPASLSTSTVAGAHNREALASALEAISAWGQAALQSGTSAASATATMTKYVDSLRNQAITLGFNRAQVEQVITAYGLSSQMLQQWRTQLTALDSSAAGLANNQLLLEQLQSIREFGGEMIAAGQGATTVVNNLKTLRNQIVRQATAFGFNATQIAALVEQVGLSDTALANFIKQMNDFETSAAGASAAAAAAAAAAKKKAEEEAAAGVVATESAGSVPRPQSVQVYLTVPYGDPEAIGLGVLNALTYDLSPN